MFEEFIISEQEIKLFKHTQPIQYENKDNQYRVFQHKNFWRWGFHQLDIQNSKLNLEALQETYKTRQEANQKAAEIYSKVSGKKIEPTLIMSRVFSLKTDPIFYNYSWYSWIGYMIGGSKRWEFYDLSLDKSVHDTFYSFTTKYADNKIKQQLKEGKPLYQVQWQTKKDFFLIIRKGLVENLFKYYDEEQYLIYQSLRQEIIEGDTDFSNFSSKEQKTWWWLMFVKPDVDLTKFFK